MQSQSTGHALSEPRLRRNRRSLLASASAALTPALLAALTAPAAAATSAPVVGTFEVIQVAVFVGVIGAALLSAIWLIRERGRTSAENTLLRGKVGELNASLQRAEAMLNLRDQRVVVWGSDHRKPELIGSLPPGSRRALKIAAPSSHSAAG